MLLIVIVAVVTYFLRYHLLWVVPLGGISSVIWLIGNDADYTNPILNRLSTTMAFLCWPFWDRIEAPFIDMCFAGLICGVVFRVLIVSHERQKNGKNRGA